MLEPKIKKLLFNQSVKEKIMGYKEEQAILNSQTESCPGGGKIDVAK